MINNFFYDNKKRHIILWVTDMSIAIASYFYLTNPAYLQKTLEKVDISQINPELDPQALQSPEFLQLLQQMMIVVALLTIGIIVILHTLAFYQCYLRKKAAIAYVKVYSALAAVSLLIWFLYNFHLRNIWILVPLAVYSLVFMAEKQTNHNSP